LLGLRLLKSSTGATVRNESLAFGTWPKSGKIEFYAAEVIPQNVSTLLLAITSFT
jgi:hypothetical protein